MNEFNPIVTSKLDRDMRGVREIIRGKMKNKSVDLPAWEKLMKVTRKMRADDLRKVRRDHRRRKPGEPHRQAYFSFRQAYLKFHRWFHSGRFLPLDDGTRVPVRT